MVKGGQTKMAVGKTLKALRGRTSQLKLSMELSVSRESISAMETERTPIPCDISQKLMNKYDDPFFAMSVASEYTNGSWVKPLDGSSVDLHRNSVADVTDEEIVEFLQAFKTVKLAKPPSSVNEYERQKIKEMALEGIDAVYALTHLIAVTCRDYGFSWNELWKEHEMKLVSNNYIRREKVSV
jgi:hypothetical protein